MEIKMYGRILTGGGRFYTYLGPLFAAIGQRQEQYNWLIKMCIRDRSGVGAFKYDKYGERFLECVKAETERMGERKETEAAAVADRGFAAELSGGTERRTAEARNGEERKERGREESVRRAGASRSSDSADGRGYEDGGLPDESYYEPDDLYFSSDSDEYGDWTIDDAMAAWESAAAEPALSLIHISAGGDRHRESGVVPQPRRQHPASAAGGPSCPLGGG